MIHLDDKKCKATHWIFSFLDKNAAVHFDSFGSEYITQEVLNKIKDKSITNNIFRIRDDDSIMCGFYYIAFIEYIIARNTLLDYCIQIYFI